jgi:hypothetical protein
VRTGGVVESAGQQLAVDVRLVGLDLGDQLVDEVLMSLEYRHPLSVPPARLRSSCPAGGEAPAGNQGRPMLRRRRQARKLRRLVRLWCELDAAAGTVPARLRPSSRVALGRG